MTTPEHPCPACDGTGWRQEMTIPSQPLIWRACRDCLGTGSITQKGPKQAKPED